MKYSKGNNFSIICFGSIVYQIIRFKVVKEEKEKNGIIDAVLYQQLAKIQLRLLQWKRLDAVGYSIGLDLPLHLLSVSPTSPPLTLLQTL